RAATGRRHERARRHPRLAPVRGAAARRARARLRRARRLAQAAPAAADRSHRVRPRALRRHLRRAVPLPGGRLLPGRDPRARRHGAPGGPPPRAAPRAPARRPRLGPPPALGARRVARRERRGARGWGGRRGGERGWASGQGAALAGLARQGGLYSLAALAEPSFAGLGPDAARIAYLQSYALIDYLARLEGERKLGNFLAELIQ